MDTTVVSPVFVYKHFMHPAQLLHATCSDHSKVRRGPEGSGFWSDVNLLCFVSFRIAFCIFIPFWSDSYVFRVFFIRVLYHFVFFSTMFEENRKDVSVITVFPLQTRCATSIMAVCYLLRSSKYQNGQGSAVMWISVCSYHFVLHFVFLLFFRVCQLHFVFFASHFEFHFICIRTTHKNEQLTWTL